LEKGIDILTYGKKAARVKQIGNN